MRSETVQLPELVYNDDLWYDQNGNATRRLDGSQDITLTYDAENWLTAMSGGVTASYVYDGDGNRVKETIGPTSGHELHESKRRQKFDSCKLVKFVAEKVGADLCHEWHELTRKAPEIREN